MLAVLQLNTVKEDLDSERELASRRPQKRTSDIQMNGVDLSNNPQVVELQRESTRQISEYKLKVQKAEIDIAALEGSVCIVCFSVITHGALSPVNLQVFCTLFSNMS